MGELDTRVAVMEERLKQYEKTIDRLESQIEKLNENLEAIVKLLNRYQGIGAALFVGVMSIWAVLTVGLQFFFKK